MAKRVKRATREVKLEAVRLSESSGWAIGEAESELGIGAGCLGCRRDTFREEGEQGFPGQGNMSSEEERIRALERDLDCDLAYPDAPTP